jgi:phospholipase C
MPVLNATDCHDPYPDPGEEYAHVNTQLYNVVSPPFNVPDPLPATAPMTGFVTDYVLNYPPTPRRFWRPRRTGGHPRRAQR